MNIPQMLPHRGSETHMYGINNTRDLRLKMTAGRSHEPQDGGSLRAAPVVGGSGIGAGGGVCSHGLSLCLVLHGVSEHRRGSLH